MPIPAIQPYPMPTAVDLPAAGTAWRPDPRRCALLIHDMQNHFLGMFPASREPVTTLVANAVRLREAGRAAGIPVFYTAQPGGMTEEQRGLLYDFWGPGMSTDPGARAIVDPLVPAADDVVLTKWRYSAFHRSELLDRLRAQGRDQLIVCGVYAHIGCLVTSIDAYSHDIQPFLVADAVADFSEADHRMALKYAAGSCAAVVTTDAVLAELATQAVPR